MFPRNVVPSSSRVKRPPKNGVLLDCFSLSDDCTVEIKCQLDAIEVFIADCLLNMFRAPLCLSSGAQEGYVSGLQDAAASRKPDK